MHFNYNAVDKLICSEFDVLNRVVCIVEGDGEVAALPVLLRRLAQWLTPHREIRVLPPLRVHRNRFLNKPEQFSRYIQLAAAKCGLEGWLLILLDADDDCPATCGAEILRIARAQAPHRDISVVLANREYEAWFLAAAQSLCGCRDFSVQESEIPADPEARRDAKGWVGHRMGKPYHEMTDQPALSACMDLAVAREKSRSFRKLCDEWTRAFPLNQ
ncbi:DUF4276 family protein [Xylophilus ampelinus]|uniref:DUF4276 family protein n=1 Tax=Xylophilus ampelinus TaxID=54067 RepID=UPI000D7BFE46|nr:DUF4276 family protein [Xylophilus ampelinus]MCS4510954.1 DUF4276 family protein [Xylophilus ampelinus]